MTEALRIVRTEAEAWAASLDSPAFYRECFRELEYARNNFFDHPLLVRLREDVLPFLLDDYGHGIDHSKKVSIEAGAIVMAEAGRDDPSRARHLALLAQASGLLHDICRLERDHARKGAEMSGVILHDYPLSAGDKEMIFHAVGSPEAFSAPLPDPNPDAGMVAGALYDADKFRWGPDNFTTTLWEMCDYHELNEREILEMFPSGVEKIREIAGTFRTPTGRAFGPEFIEIGLNLGKNIYARLRDICEESDKG